MRRVEKRIKLGVLGDEFFDAAVGRMGGFGWACRMLATCFNGDRSLGVDVVFLTGELLATSAGNEINVHGSRLLLRDANRWRLLRRLRRERFDLILTIDYNLGFRFFFRAMPRTPFAVWVRDPRPPEDVEVISTLQIPGREGERPQGIEPMDCTSLGGIIRESRWLRRAVLFATTAPYLAGKISGAYGVEPAEALFLPNIIELKPSSAGKHPQPRVVFLARLDPYKRPWLVMALARCFPDVEFMVLGQAHFEGAGAWKPVDLPSNVRLLGHADEALKAEMLSSAWVLVNTSIHEGLAVSFLEALACETPLLSGQNPESVVSRFGICVGRSTGTGMEALPRFAEGLQRLLTDDALRLRLGREGRAWVTETHGRARFLKAFENLCRRAGIAWAAPPTI